MFPEQRVPLGKTDVSVTRLGLGAAPLGGLLEAVDEREAHATVERAYDAGLRFFDTAPLYGYGVSESRVGAVLARKPRDEFALATKVGRLLRQDAPPDPTQFHEGKPFYQGTFDLAPVRDYSYDGVMRSLEESYQRLGMDRVDIAHIHDPDDYHDEAISGAFRALADLRSQGVIRAIGAGMNGAEMLARFAREADFDCFLLAGRYTLLDQSGGEELLPLCQEREIAVIAAGVYNSGILANPHRGATYDYVPAEAALVERAQRLDAICRRHDVPLKAAAIQFPLGHPAVTAVVIGARSVDEIDENLAMFRVPIPDDLWVELKVEGCLPQDAPTPELSSVG